MSILTVKELHHALTTLIDAGAGDLPVFRDDSDSQVERAPITSGPRHVAAKHDHLTKTEHIVIG